MDIRRRTVTPGVMRIDSALAAAWSRRDVEEVSSRFMRILERDLMGTDKGPLTPGIVEERKRVQIHFLRHHLEEKIKARLKDLVLLGFEPPETR